MAKIPTQTENPTGLHQRYKIQKVVGYKPEYVSETKWTEAHTRYVPILKDAEADSEYFVMRLDEGGKDREHIKACRIGVRAYANAIEHHIPELAKDLRERYPLLDPTPSTEPGEDQEQLWQEVCYAIRAKPISNNAEFSSLIELLKERFTLTRKSKDNG